MARGVIAQLGLERDPTLRISFVAEDPEPVPEAVYEPRAEELRALAENAEAELHELAARVARGGLQIECRAAEGNPREAIPRIAEESHADLIVVGTHGRRGLAHLALGSIAESVVRAARCPVLTVGKASIEAAHAATP
jgi:nucleotide-binding universal stress UspA family protein